MDDLIILSPSPPRTPSPCVPDRRHRIISSPVPEEGRPIDIHMGITLDLEGTTSKKRPLREPEAGPKNKRGKVFSSIMPPSTAPEQEEDGVVGDCPDGDVAATPTADDYANLFFCESSEDEDEARSDLIAATRPLRRASTASSSQPSVASKGKRRRRRRISFGASIPTVHLLEEVPPARAMTDEERSALWYTRADLDALKCYAQTSIQEMRSRIVDEAAEYGRDRSKFRSAMLILEKDTDSSIRGLEHRVFRRRQTRQGLIRDVLQCQSHFKGLERFGHSMDTKERASLLAKVSKERSVGARNVALFDAKDDYDEVYGEVDVDESEHQKKQARQVSLG